MTTKDSEITTLISSSSSNPRDLAFSLQVRITRMRSFIISSMSSSYLDFHLTLTDNHAMKLSIKLKKLLWAHSWKLLVVSLRRWLGTQRRLRK